MPEPSITFNLNEMESEKMKTTSKTSLHKIPEEANEDDFAKRKPSNSFKFGQDLADQASKKLNFGVEPKKPSE